MHRHDQNMGRGRNDSNRNRDDERRGQSMQDHDDDDWDERGYDVRSGDRHSQLHSRWMDEERRREELHSGRSSGGREHPMQGQGFDEGRRLGGRGFYDRDRDYLERGGQGGYGGYGGMGGRERDREEEMRRFDRGHDRPQDYGTRSIGFRGRMGEDYGYGGFGHMGQSDMYSDRHMGGDEDRRGMGRGMDRGFGGTDRGYGTERYSDRYAHDRNYGMERSGMRQGYGGTDRSYHGEQQRMGEPQRTTQGGQYGGSQYGGMDRSMGNQAPMRGKGPKNYSRSDDRIREEVCELLEDADLDASEIDVKVRDGEVTLEGSVQDRWAKREAEDVIAHARGVRDCHNQLKVQARNQQQQTIGQSHDQTQARGSAGNVTKSQGQQQRTS